MLFSSMRRRINLLISTILCLKEFSTVTIKEGSAKVSDNLGGTYQMPQDIQEHRKGFQPRGKHLVGRAL